MSDGINIRFGKGPFDKLRDRGSFGTVSELASGEPAEPVELAVKLRDRGSSPVRSVSLPNWPLSSGQDQNISVPPLGAKLKGSNGGVAVGLPHRNSSVFKQTHINQREVKVVKVKTRASEAKGPFPGGKRVGSWGKK